MVLRNFQLEDIGDLQRYYNGPDSRIRFYCDLIASRIADFGTIWEKIYELLKSNMSSHYIYTQKRTMN